MAREHSNRSGGYSLFFRAGRAMCLKFLVVAACLAVTAAPAMAAQPHGNPVGVVVYLFTFLFFIASMAVLIGWLSRLGSPVPSGWREIRYSAYFFILWSAFAFTSYVLEYAAGWIDADRIGSFTLHIEPAGGQAFLTWLYYLVRLDYLLSVPAMVFLFLGLARLLEQAKLTTPDDNNPAGDWTGGKREDGV